MRLRRIAVVLFIVALYAPSLAQAGVLVGAGAGYKRMLTEIDAAFTKQTGVVVEESFGHMGRITSQAAQGGPIDVIFGDQEFLRAAKGLDVDRYIQVGRGRLVLAWPTGVSLKSPEDLKLPTIDRIALPDAKNAIYGKAGMEFLANSGLLDAVRAKLVHVGTVPQVTAYLVSGEVKAGLLNVTDAIGVRDKIGGYLEIDQKFYSPIKIVCAVMKRAKDNQNLKRYLEFLATPAARAIVEKYGL
ncbi:molybdate ABC transporter substrate-binding protein [Fundidesulfovibrio butyratiphilus]